MSRTSIGGLALLALAAACGQGPSHAPKGGDADVKDAAALNADMAAGNGQAATSGKGQATPAEIEARVVKIVSEHLGVEASRVTKDARFIEDLGADSLDVVELVMAFEEEFGVEIPDDAAERLATVGDVVRYVEANRA